MGEYCRGCRWLPAHPNPIESRLWTPPSTWAPCSSSKENIERSRRERWNNIWSVMDGKRKSWGSQFSSCQAYQPCFSWETCSVKKHGLNVWTDPFRLFSRAEVSSDGKSLVCPNLTSLSLGLWETAHHEKELLHQGICVGFSEDDRFCWALLSRDEENIWFLRGNVCFNHSEVSGFGLEKSLVQAGLQRVSPHGETCEEVGWGLSLGMVGLGWSAQLCLPQVGAGIRDLPSLWPPYGHGCCRGTHAEGERRSCPQKSKPSPLLPFLSPPKACRGVDVCGSGNPWVRSGKRRRAGLSPWEHSPAQVRFSPPRGQTRALAQVCFWARSASPSTLEVAGTGNGAGRSRTGGRDREISCQAELLEPARSSEGMDVVTAGALPHPTLTAAMGGFLLCPWPGWNICCLIFLLLIRSSGLLSPWSAGSSLTSGLGARFHCCFCSAWKPQRDSFSAPKLGLRGSLCRVSCPLALKWAAIAAS